MLKGLGLFALAYLVHKISVIARNAIATRNMSESEISYLRTMEIMGPDAVRNFMWEVFRQYNPVWLMVASVASMVIFASGVWVFLDGWWLIESAAIKYGIGYLMAGFLVSAFHISKGHVGAIGISATFILGFIVWPIYLWFNVNNMIWERRMRI